jgi:hypothetical protein
MIISLFLDCQLPKAIGADDEVPAVVVPAAEVHAGKLVADMLGADLACCRAYSDNNIALSRLQENG